jgi:pimeloyl-ACP methyl ester carboxylesterase
MPELETDTSAACATCRHVARRPEIPGGSNGFSPAQLARLAAPTIAVFAERDVFWNGKAAAATATARLPGCQTVLVRGGRHLLSRSNTEEVAAGIVRFFGSRGLL